MRNILKNSYLRSSFFALVVAAAGLFGPSASAAEAKPEIRSSETPIVQVAQTAEERLADQVRADGGEIEQAPSTGEKVNADVQQAAQDVYDAGRQADGYLRENLGNGLGGVLGGVAQTGTAIGGLATQGAGYVAEGATDAAITVGNAVESGFNATVDGISSGAKEVGNFFSNLFSSDEKPAEPAPAPAVEQPAVEAPAPAPEQPAPAQPTVGEKVNADVQQAAQDVYDAGRQADGYLRENLGDGLGGVLGGVTQTGTGIAGLATQGAGYVAEGATDAAITVGNAVESGFNATVDATKEAANATYDNVLEPTGNAIADGFNATVDATKDAANATYDNVLKPAGNAIADGFNATVDGISSGAQKVGNFFTGLFKSDEKPAEPAPAPAVEQPAVEAPAPAPEQPAPAPEQPTVGEKVNADVQQAAQDVYNAGRQADGYLRENLGDGLGSVLGGVTQTGTGIAGLATQGAGYVAEGATDATITVSNAVESGFNATVDATKDAANATYDNVLKPTGNAIADGFNATVDGISSGAKEVGNFFTGLFKSDEKPAEPAPAPAVEQPAVEAPAPAPEQLAPAQPTEERGIMDKVGDFITKDTPDAIKTAVEKTGEFITKDAPEAIKTAAEKTGEVLSDAADAVTPSKETMEKLNPFSDNTEKNMKALAEFLKANGLPEDKIQEALLVAQGKQNKAPEAEKTSAQEQVAPAPEKPAAEVEKPAEEKTVTQQVGDLITKDTPEAIKTAAEKTGEFITKDAPDAIKTAAEKTGEFLGDIAEKLTPDKDTLNKINPMNWVKSDEKPAETAQAEAVTGQTEQAAAPGNSSDGLKDTLAKASHATYSLTNKVRNDVNITINGMVNGGSER